MSKLHAIRPNNNEMDDNYLPPPGPAGHYPPPPGSNAAYPPPTAYSNPQGAPVPYPAAYSQPPPPRQNPPTYAASTSEPRSTRRASDDWAGASFDNKNIRVAFIRKVYMILTVQLLFTVALICVFIFVEPIKNFMITRGFWLYIVAYVVFLATYIALICCPVVRRKYPYNYLALTIFTLALSLMTATISSYHDTGIVLIVMAVTAGVCIAVSIFACQTKIDFTRSYCTLIGFALLITVFLFGIAIGLAYGINHNSQQFKILNIVYGSLGALVFALFLAIETQQIMGNKKHCLSEEEYIYGATQLYLDIIIIFMCLLGAGGGGN